MWSRSFMIFFSFVLKSELKTFEARWAKRCVYLKQRDKRGRQRPTAARLEHQRILGLAVWAVPWSRLVGSWHLHERVVVLGYGALHLHVRTLFGHTCVYWFRFDKEIYLIITQTAPWPFYTISVRTPIQHYNFSNKISLSETDCQNFLTTRFIYLPDELFNRQTDRLWQNHH